MSHIIERLGHQGDGIAAGPVFVSRALPGEDVDGTVEDGRIHAPRILTPSPDRVAPLCRHFKSCGGCAVMHASDRFVASWKAGIVKDALNAHGIEAVVRGVETSPIRSRRRATFSGRRLRSGAVVGFHARLSATVLDIPECQLLRPELLNARGACSDIVDLLGSRKGEMKFALTVSAAGIDLEASGGRDPDRTAWVELAAIAERHDLARLVVDGEIVASRRNPVQDFDGIGVVPPPGAFLQATREGETALRNAVEEAVGDAARVLELFSGCGTFALPLSRRVTVHAVEKEPALLAALDRAWRHGTGLKTVTTEARDLFRRPFEPDELSGFDAVVIDPPRAGAEAQTRRICAASVPRIAAVSCNPATFARDAGLLLEAGYRLDWVKVVDQFRWSPHVELAAQFTHTHMARKQTRRRR